MGSLADKAKLRSKWLKLDLNETVLVKYLGWKEIQSTFDPDQQTIRYELELKGTKKYWDNGSTYIMLAFDEIPKGSFINITRKPKIDKQGNVVEGKSIYEVALFEGNPPAETETTPDDSDEDSPF